MPFTRAELIERFAAAAERGNAAVFVGAGLSVGAGLPSWPELLARPLEESGIPYSDYDLPLLAEYILSEGVYGEERLNAHILAEVTKEGAAPTEVHHALARLPIDQIWTTNYDTLIEEACGDAADIVTADDEIRSIGGSRRVIVKMHGSITRDTIPVWSSPPVITRTHFEKYDVERQRTWALLNAAYLSRTLLFLGFSFTDPNIEILQRLARKYGTAWGNRHMTIMKQPDSPESLSMFHFKVRDLENNGVRVLIIKDYTELEIILKALVRRTRPPRLFISGSSEFPNDANYIGHCSQVAGEIVDHQNWELSSLGGEAGWYVSLHASRLRRAEGTYSAEKIVLNYRKKNAPPPSIEERMGTAAFTDLEREPLVQKLLDESRAILVIGGSKRTMEEIDWALERGLGVIPLAVSGRAAHEYWSNHEQAPPPLGGQPVDPEAWKRLADTTPGVAARAAGVLLAQAMYAEARERVSGPA